MKKVEDYLLFLKSKGFILGEDAIGFIKFGKAYTSASDELVIAAIECTLKIQQSFDGSFYISLLEMFMEKNILTKKQAIRFVEKTQLFPL